MKVSVVKSSKNKNSYRTPVEQLDGMPHDPVVGNRLLLTSSTHESGGIATSEVQEIEKKDWGYIIKTEFSVYEIKEVK